jgi:hypothetical protein
MKFLIMMMIVTPAILFLATLVASFKKNPNDMKFKDRLHKPKLPLGTPHGHFDCYLFDQNGMQMLTIVKHNKF